MTGPDRVNLERVVPGPDYPESRIERGDRVVNLIVVVLAIVGAIVIATAAASRGAPESSSSPSPAEPAGAGREGNAQALLGAPQFHRPALAADLGPDAQEAAPPTVDRYLGTATWYCLSGSSACTRGYSGDDLVAAIDTDLGFARGDVLTVRYRDRAVTVTVVDTCGCPGERLIDLTSGAFQRLAPLGHGVIPVTLEPAGGPTLPPTEALP